MYPISISLEKGSYTFSVFGTQPKFSWSIIFWLKLAKSLVVEEHFTACNQTSKSLKGCTRAFLQSDMAEHFYSQGCTRAFLQSKFAEHFYWLQSQTDEPIVLDEACNESGGGAVFSLQTDFIGSQRLHQSISTIKCCRAVLKSREHFYWLQSQTDEPIVPDEACWL